MPSSSLTNLSPGVAIGGTSGIAPFMPVFDPVLHTGLFEDFFRYNTNDWTLTETQAGATQALTSGHGGLLLFTNSAADDDLCSLQHATTQLACAAGRKFWMRVRFSCSEATQSDIFIGIAATDTSPIASAPSDYIAFTKDDGSTALNFKTAGGSAGIYTAANIATLAADTFVTLDVYYDGGSTLMVWANGNQVASQTAAFASLLPSAVLRPTIALQNGDGNARTLTTDYILTYSER